MATELRLVYSNLSSLESDHRDNLRKGRAFVVDATGPGERERCQLVLVHPTTGATLALEAEVVWVKRDAPGAGVGVQLVDAGEAQREVLQRFVESSPVTMGAEPPNPRGEPEERGEPAAPRNVHERVRALQIREREVMARQGSLTERVALERCYGSGVWEGLLQNPQLTPPEVARIAKNGALPRPLAQAIVSNAAWVTVPEVQRALLGNPRVSGPHLEKVLRAMAKGDLERVASLTAYRSEVRQAAGRMLGRK
jgi:PilZ domain